MTGERARFRVAADVVTRETPDGLLLVHLDTGAAWGLDDVGAEVCRRLDGMTDIGTIRAALQDLYDVAADVLARDIDTLLDELQGAGLVERVND